MEIQNATIVIACVAFLITQVHLWKTARRLERKSDESWERAQKTIEDTLAELQENLFTEETATKMWNWFLTAPIKTGKTTENEDGTKTEETTTPYASLINSTATIFFKKISGMKGGAMKGANALLGEIEGGNIAPLMSFLGPQKGEDPTLWAIKQKLAPMISDIIEKKLNSALGNITQGGAENW